MIANTLYTIGHSNRSTEELVSMLKEYSIQFSVDIRANPYSSRFPHFSQDLLRESLNASGIEYHWAGRQLGGNREPSQADSHPALDGNSLKGFAEYMESSQFEKAIVQLINLASSDNTAIMCAEKSVSHCHRALISDYLTLKNIKVVHIVGPGHIVSHELSQLARTESTKLVYDRLINAPLKLHKLSALYWFCKTLDYLD